MACAVSDLGFRISDLGFFKNFVQFRPSSSIIEIRTTHDESNLCYLFGLIMNPDLSGFADKAMAFVKFTSKKGLAAERIAEQKQCKSCV
jgi:hypothetical protein